MRMANLFLCLFLAFVQPISAEIVTFANDKVVRVVENERYKEAIFKVYTNDSMGSGFAITPWLIVTCYHVVEGKDGGVFVRPTVISGYQQVMKATYVGGDKDRDVAVLRLDVPVTIFFKIADNEASVGDAVAAIRSRPEYIAKFSKTSIKELWAFSTSYAGTLNRSVEHGNSGSPVVNVNYEVIGIVVGLLPKDGDRGVYTNVANLKEVLKTLNITP